ncbi:hypothetical protein [Gracilimonas mengyeensis]|uniref:Lipoprotein n=1 Tax=Gracilimonas mengyeensis TaxID=1302730 RepID=A0A521ESX2_9BACT|nr:hypothetical protein [Gracilimonas mengyeensis]SMO87019.1 hypothetical protein SAMN06265219_113122 [Gracilimonas mengyeensis]
MKRERFKKEHNKPTLFNLVLLFTMPFVLGSGCSTDSGPEEGPVPFEILGQFQGLEKDVVDCHFNFSNINPDSIRKGEGLSNWEFVITTKTEFNTYINCQDSVAVNFDEEFILAGTTITQPSFPMVVGQHIKFTSNTLRYKIGIIKSVAAQPGNANYIVKVLSREYLGYPIVFDVYWEEEL